MLLDCGAGEDSWESFGLQGDQNSQSYRKSILSIHWKDWCWSWSSNTLATWCKELTHYKRFWCWVRLKAGGEGDDRGWDGWMASPIQWTWVWASSGRWWRIRNLACCSPWGLKELNMTEWLNNNNKISACSVFIKSETSLWCCVSLRKEHGDLGTIAWKQDYPRWPSRSITRWGILFFYIQCSGICRVGGLYKQREHIFAGGHRRGPIEVHAMVLSGYFGFFVARDHLGRWEVIILTEAIDLDNKRPQGYFSGSRSDEKYM